MVSSFAISFKIIYALRNGLAGIADIKTKDRTKFRIEQTNAKYIRTKYDCTWKLQPSFLRHPRCQQYDPGY